MNKKITLLLLLLIGIMSVKTTYAQNFVHPGLPFTINDLERMKANRTDVEPWKESWDMILGFQQSSLDYQMLGPAVDVANKGNDNLFISDVNAALYHALQWYFTKDSAHAELAMSIIEPWATTHKSWSGTSAHLGAAWRGGTLVQACEILRYTYPGWTDELTVKTEDYFLDVYWPLFRMPNPLRAANQGANNLMGAMYVAVYINDQEKFDACIDAYLNDQCAGLANTLPNGQNGDTGRDQGHAMGMIGNLATVAEIGWAQGVDLYGAMDNRLLDVHEYWSKYNLGNDVPWIDYGTCYGYYTSIGEAGRNASTSDAIPVTELVYGAYVVRKGLTSPYVTEYQAGLPIDENTFLFHKDQSFMTYAPLMYDNDSELIYSDVQAENVTSVDVGSVGIAGSTEVNDGVWTVKGSGSDIYGGGSQDSFHYAYLPMSGDGSFIAKISSMDVSNGLGRAAIVIRESLSSNSKMAVVGGRSVTGAEFSSRGFDSADGNGRQTFPLSILPTSSWIKIERRGEHISGYVGVDGVTWVPMQATKFTMSEDYYIGLGVTSNSNSLTCTATFTNVQVGRVNEENENITGGYSQIEAESYSTMSGITTESTTDVSGGNQIASIEVGDWIEYEINVPYSGSYKMGYRIASASENGNITLSLGEDTLETITFGATGGDDQWSTVESAESFYLSKGVKTIKLLANSNGLKLNWLRLLIDCKDVPVVPYVESFDALGTSLSKKQTAELNLLPGFKASLQPLASEGGSWSWVGPNDFTSNERIVVLENIAANQSGVYEVSYTSDCGLITKQNFTINVLDALYFEAEDYVTMQGVTTEVTSDVSGGLNVTSIASGDWMEYKFDAPFRGLYTVDYRLASENNIDFDLSVNGSLANQVSFNATGGVQVWETNTQSLLVYLEEGEQTLRISSTSNDWKINWVEFSLSQTIIECALPFNHGGFYISKNIPEWKSEQINISCAEEVDVLIPIEISGAVLDTDYFNVFYKVNGGEKIAATEIVKSDDRTFVSIQNIVGDALEIIIESKITNSIFYTVWDIKLYDGPGKFDRFEAEDYDEVLASNTENTSDTGGGINMAGIKNSSYLMFANKDLTGVNGINTRFASKTSGGNLEVRIDSPTGELLGTIPLSGTGNWQNWTTVSGALASKSGFYDVYFVFTTVGTGYVGNVNWFEFYTDGLSTTDLDTEEVFNIYPNPVQGYLNIGLNQGAELSQANLYNIVGEHVLSTKKIKIDTSNLKSGIYILDIETNKGRFRSKVIKK